MSRRTWVVAAGLTFAATNEAHAQIDPRCLDFVPPEDWTPADDVAQQDFLMNYFALSTTFSPVHAPVPHEGGHGAIGMDVAIIPPLGCAHRFVLNFIKTESTNKSPVIPKLRASYAFPTVGKTTPYAGM